MGEIKAGAYGLLRVEGTGAKPHLNLCPKPGSPWPGQGILTPGPFPTQMSPEEEWISRAQPFTCLSHQGLRSEKQVAPASPSWFLALSL